ncbi:Uncharacterised protein [Escherichia coli]|uniref:Uncharacterized protein n=1 Tax=Escherichia coli TaxID=562 RepID=A0A377A3J0_ECOLX|nr:Uncharacterised protein [Escherichia coli]
MPDGSIEQWDELVFLVNTGCIRQCFIPNSIYTDTGHCNCVRWWFRGREYVGGDQLEHYRLHSSLQLWS